MFLGQHLPPKAGHQGPHSISSGQWRGFTLTPNLQAVRGGARRRVSGQLCLGEPPCPAPGHALPHPHPLLEAPGFPHSHPQPNTGLRAPSRGARSVWPRVPAHPQAGCCVYCPLTIELCDLEHPPQRCQSPPPPRARIQRRAGQGDIVGTHQARDRRVPHTCMRTERGGPGGWGHSPPAPPTPPSQGHLPRVTAATGLPASSSL